jgi:H+/Cl- antiporter ClcA
MKTIKSILVFAVTYIIGYLFLSVLGCMFFDANGNHNHYSDILGNKSWFIIYSLFIGVWIAETASHEYYESLEIKKKY